MSARTGDPTPFTHAVASFDPDARRVLLWTRVDTATAAIGWHVSASADGAAVVAEGRATIPAGTDGCVTIEVDGLAPATTYHYWFDLDGVRSPTGRTRTLPEGPTERFRVAMVCCADPSRRPLTPYRAVAEDEVDVVLHLGDYIYETAGDEHRVAPDRDCLTLADYRLRHAFLREDPDLQALHLRHPMIFIWDDHDVADNAWRHGAKAHDPDEHGPWADRLLAAATARQEWLPARLRDPDDLIAMWRSFAIGDLAELVVLDTRIPGRDLQAEDPGAKPLHDPDRSILGDAQRQWAFDRVRDTERPWCLLATAVVLSRLELPVPAGTVVDQAMPSGYGVVDGAAVCTDEWDGYPVERRKLLNVVAERGGGTVIVSGDVHSAWALETVNFPGTPPVAVELVAHAVSSTPMGDQLPGLERTAEHTADEVPNQRWHDLHHQGYVRLDIGADEVRADWFATERTDPDPDLDRGAVPTEHLASWTVDRSYPPHLRPADPPAPRPAGPDGGRDRHPDDEGDGGDEGEADEGAITLAPVALPPRLPADDVLRPVPTGFRIRRVVRRVLPAAAVAVAVALVVRRRRLSRR